MESSNSEPVGSKEEMKAFMNEGIDLILLSLWTAMRAAVENGWGGLNSRRNAERTVSSVLNYFILSDDPKDSDEIADILESGLDELRTVADDGSIEEVTETLLDLYEAYLDGNYKFIQELKANVDKVTKGTCTKINDQTTDMMMVDAPEHSSNHKPEAMSVDEPKADDDWTLVPSRKNKGKRN